VIKAEALSAPPRYRLTMLRRLINRLVRLQIRLGLPPRHRYLLGVTGRRTGSVHTTPVGLVEDRGARWLVAPYGEVAWVRNARAAGTVSLQRGSRVECVRLQSAGAEEAGPVRQRYVALEPITRPYFDAHPGASEAAFRVEAGRHPVFRIVRPAAGLECR
jgi:deazaflavin-dependent oxidoreductase (nitroreductase family)